MGQRPYACPCVALHRDGQPHVPHRALGHLACAQIFVRMFLFIYLHSFVPKPSTNVSVKILQRDLLVLIWKTQPYEHYTQM